MENFPPLLLKFFVLYYKRNIKHFFRIDIQLYQHEWKLEKREIVWKHDARRAECFRTISSFSNFHEYQHGKCFIFLNLIVVRYLGVALNGLFLL